MTEDRIIHSVATLSRKGGGLPVAVAQLSEALENFDRLVEIIAPDSPRSDWVEFGANQEILNVANPKRSLARFLAISHRMEAEHRTEPIALIHQHGIWRWQVVEISRFAERHQVPLVWSPHGMLEPWALNHHRWRKRLAWLAYQKRALDRAAAFHATSAEEAEHLRKLGFRAPIAVIPNGVAPVSPVPLDPAAVGAVKERRIALFLSRIHPKKGLPLLLKAWSILQPKDWELVIAGNDEGGHERELRKQAANLGLEKRIRFAGPVYEADKDTLYRRADLFVLPTYSENFGMVIAEALQYGVPVITTTGTPWGNLVECGCGWRVDPEEGAIAGALDEAVRMSAEDLKAMGARGIDLINRDYRWPQIARRMSAFYDWILGRGQKPDCLA